MEDKVIFELKPKFNFLYELFMPTGYRMTRVFITIIVNIIILIGLQYTKGIEVFNNNVEFFNAISSLFWIVLLVTIVVFIVILILQIMQFKKITYYFYNDYMEYKDTFLNKHSKKVMYANIKEVEIRRTVFDRIMGFGTIILYSNAEKSTSSAVIIFAIRNAEEEYKRIDNIVHSK